MNHRLDTLVLEKSIFGGKLEPLSASSSNLVCIRRDPGLFEKQTSQHTREMSPVPWHLLLQNELELGKQMCDTQFKMLFLLRKINLQNVSFWTLFCFICRRRELLELPVLDKVYWRCSTVIWKDSPGTDLVANQHFNGEVQKMDQHFLDDVWDVLLRELNFLFHIFHFKIPALELIW